MVLIVSEMTQMHHILSLDGVNLKFLSNTSNFVFHLISLDSLVLRYPRFDGDFTLKHKISFPGVKILLIHPEIRQIDHI